MTESSSQFTEEELIRLIGEEFSIDAERLRPDVTFGELGLDSLALLELIVSLENRTGARLLEDIQGVAPSDTLATAAAQLASTLRTADTAR
ncbi:acyl carrier protein [Streptomyces sp. HD]|uniref:acyl carrier protein n=1 Tax=Streptomyces sp. HD TaxID=3020892 RepID=UPI00232CF599|nr:acyl carrier protein [Streptomyces sp. HD]MDC0770735.1 acyl carrier protein [Streptomyces sp. HD]